MINHIKNISSVNSKLLTRIDQKLQRLQKKRPLSKTSVRKLQEQFEVEMTYNSNAIEGNSLTLKETYLVINEGVTVKGKPLKDHLEAKDHHEALEFIYELIAHDTKPTLSEHLIRILHQLIMKKTDEQFAGTYRNSNVVIAGADHTPPDVLQVPHAMKKLMTWYTKEHNRLHPVELATLLHHQLVFIHPFFDGNGRTARLLMNVILMRAGYPLAVILKNDRQKYYRALQSADKGDLSLLIKLVAQAVERSLDIYFKVLTPVSQMREDYLSLYEVSQDTPYSEKYLNLLARQGKLEAHKQGRNWLTTKEAVSRYVESRERKRTLNPQKTVTKQSRQSFIKPTIIYSENVSPLEESLKELIDEEGE